MDSSVTLDDVAAIAGVSGKTVSRVVNGDRHVSQRTREIVEQAIAALDYRPNLAARSLVTSRTFLLAAITPKLPVLRAFYFNFMHDRLLRASIEAGFHLIVEELDFADSDKIKYLEKALRHLRVEGVVLISPVSDDIETMDLLDRFNINYVRISPTSDLNRSDMASFDEEQGMKDLATHLYSLGHRRVVVTTVENPTGTARHNFFLKSWFEAGGDADEICLHPIDWRVPAVAIGRQVAAAWLSRADRPTAIVGFNDEVSAGVIGYALEHGLNVPRDLSVVGFDDGDVAQAVWPPLTTIRQPVEEMARAAVSLLLEPRPSAERREIICPVTFVIRGSTARAPDRV